MNIAQNASKVKPHSWGDFETALNQSIRFRHSGALLRHCAEHPEDRECAVRVLEEIGGSSTVCSRRDLLTIADDVRADGWIKVARSRCDSCRPFGADYCCPACGRMENVSQDMRRTQIHKSGGGK